MRIPKWAFKLALIFVIHFKSNLNFEIKTQTQILKYLVGQFEKKLFETFQVFRLADWVVNAKVEIAKWIFFRCFETSTVEIDIELVLK